MCVKYYELRCMFQKKAHRQSWRICACLSVKIRVFFGVRFERRKVVKKANVQEN